MEVTDHAKGVPLAMDRLADVAAVDTVCGTFVSRFTTLNEYLSVFEEAIHWNVTWLNVSFMLTPVVHSEFSSGNTKAAPSGTGGGSSLPPQEINKANMDNIAIFRIIFL
jgi:hypothetical protein